eukprot:378820-Hanusia_phi.AAC.1
MKRDLPGDTRVPLAFLAHCSRREMGEDTVPAVAGPAGGREESRIRRQEVLVEGRAEEENEKVEELGRQKNSVNFVKVRNGGGGGGGGS